jgi:hypothetical protein
MVSKWTKLVITNLFVENNGILAVAVKSQFPNRATNNLLLTHEALRYVSSVGSGYG